MFNTNTEIDYRKIALNGLLKLATGKVNDIMKLMFLSESPDETDIENTNFTSVSEIKKDKAGSIQVKFFDRQQALETLYKIADENTSNAQAEGFLKSITES